MTSPKNITKAALIIGVISLVGLGVMLLLRPDWGTFNGWPIMGLGLAVVLLIVSYVRGAYLAGQKQAARVDKLNDCYRGVPAEEEIT